ncbi:ACR036Cp [Eremothecium gossypii ATCC 10895]|uniref:Protein FYV8 n=1 Tax=Eremothecium gossypii (strain ATCC 10895 / CBS 109.51 / FGSC 9923 / NRRL Y-1056) TaxID=284811 RepID=FYV8_EREGS|nr:ACR036Cp [Eremothecium gossypii ATCC 10895]Q75C80.2 RecName: Full=Protein FYV8 [Eremothecium gossypii ATCC 10895]AAS51263.2 ACR036Cp [Eremothecium gossypii ATCC 10895]AEY95554.1 FACR036Cp [Eremothecium gossypii FDAG1]
MPDKVNRRKSQRWVSVSKGNYDGADWDSDYSGEELESSPTRQHETICKLPELPKLNLGGSTEERGRPGSGDGLAPRGAAEEEAASSGRGAATPAHEVQTPRSGAAAQKFSLTSSSRSVSSMNKELDTLMDEISKEMTAGGSEPPLVETRQSPVDFNRVGVPALKPEGHLADDSSDSDGEDAAGGSSLSQSFEHLNMSLKTDTASGQAMPLSSPRGSSALPAGRDSLALKKGASPDRASEGSLSSRSEDLLAVDRTAGENTRLKTTNSSDDDTDSLPELITSDAKFRADGASGPARVVSSGVETVIHRAIAPEVAPRLRITSKTDLSYRYDTSSEDDSEAYSGIEDDYLSYQPSPNISDAATFHGHRSRTGSPARAPHPLVEQEEHIELPVISDDDSTSKSSVRDNYYSEESDNTTSQALVTQDNSSHDTIHDTIRERSFDKSTSGSVTHSIPVIKDDNEDWQNQLRQQSVHLGAWNPDTEGKRGAFLTQASPMSTNKGMCGSQDEETTGDDQQLAEPCNDDSDSVWEGFPSVGEYEDLQSVADIKTIYDNQTLYNVPGIITSSTSVPPLPSSMSELTSRQDTSILSESTSGSGLDSDSLMRVVEGQRHAPKPSMFKENFGQTPEVQVEHLVNSPVPSLDICALIEGPQSHSFKRDKLNSHIEDLNAYSSGAQTWIKYALKSTQSSSNITFDEYVISKHVQDAYAQAEEVSKKHSVTNAVNQNVSQLRKKVFSHSMKEGAKGLLSSIGKKKL